MKLVRKELSSGGTTYTQFRTELKNLDIVKRLKDPHLVKVLKAYKYKDNFNLVFHCAMTNLGAYLREPRYEAHSTTNSTTFANPLWAQLLGIGKALDRIINYTPDMRSPGPPLYGYHFDLKPANILVEDNGTLLISDFGQARFQDVGGTSRITPLGGTEAYAPPEIDSQENKYNRKYDVWSMGCIFLEVCSFVVKGHEGLRTLDAIRTTKTRPNVTDDRFFHICHSTSRYELKPSIQKWMKTLSEADSLPDQKSRAFISEIVALIGQMLDVDVRQRSSSQDLCSTLSGILDRYCSGPACQTPASDRFVLRPGDAECGNEITSHIYSMFYSNGGPWLQSGLKVVEDCEHIITLIIVNDTGVRYEKLGARASTKVIPRYASRGQKDSGVSGYYLHFSLVERNSVALLPAKLYFGEDKDIRETHSILMGQEIKSSRGLAGCTIQDKRSGRAFRGRPASKTGKYTGGDGHMTVQLWSEKSYLDHSRPREESRRSVRQPVFTQPAHRRIVVYLATGILVVRVAKNARIEHRTSSSDPTLLRIVPTDAVRDPSFTASLLSPSHGETTVGIPLSKMELKEEEDKGAFECKSIELRFAAESDLKAVNTMYRKLKEEWRTEFQEIEKFKKRMGEVLGYAPD
jgi:serine/threonine protein kinase